MAKILLVEDESNVREVIRLLLATEGYQVIEAADGRAAYDKAISEKPDIVLLDLMMPVMNGLDLLRKLKTNPLTASILAIVITGSGQPQDERWSLQWGALDYITKPWGRGELQDRVRIAINHLQSAPFGPLSLATPPNHSSAPAPSSGSGLQEKRGVSMTKILVAEDELAVRQVIRLLLAAQGYEIIEAADGGSAYDKVVSAKPDIILLDVMMPVMNGFDVLRKLKANPDTASIPVIMVTGKGQSQDERRGMQAGALDYISKPWGPGELEDRIRIALSYLQSNPSSAPSPTTSANSAHGTAPRLTRQRPSAPPPARRPS